MEFIGSLLVLAATALLVGGGLMGPSVGVAPGSLQVSPRAAQTQPAVASPSLQAGTQVAEVEANNADTDGVEQGDQNGPDGTSDVGATDGTQDVAATAAPAIGAPAARQTAEAYLSAGAATKVELDDEDGQLVYSIEIGASEVKVDAMTGAILRVEGNSNDTSD